MYMKHIDEHKHKYMIHTHKHNLMTCSNQTGQVGLGVGPWIDNLETRVHSRSE